jgi:hypothetical protein
MRKSKGGRRKKVKPPKKPFVPRRIDVTDQGGGVGIVGYSGPRPTLGEPN